MNDDEIHTTPPSPLRKQRRRKTKSQKRKVHFLPERYESASPFGKQILDIMIEKGLTIQYISDTLGVNWQRFTYFLEHSHTLTHQEILRLATILGVNPVEFLVSFLVATSMREDDPFHVLVAELMVVVNGYMQVPDEKKSIAISTVQALFVALGQENTTLMDVFVQEEKRYQAAREKQQHEPNKERE